LRFLILSDLHANWDALQAVLDEVELSEIDAAIILGDFVGYGPEPNRVIDTVRGLHCSVVAIRGNHDRVACGISSSKGFNPTAARVAEWTAERLLPRSREFLKTLSVGPQWVAESTEICHGSPKDEDDYILCGDSARRGFAATKAQVVFFGHSHLPSRFQLHEGAVDLGLLAGEGSLDLKETDRYLLNPGSVGQPRDKDPRAAYMTYCSSTRRVSWHRVAYPIGATVEKMRARGLPEAVAARLFLGE